MAAQVSLHPIAAPLIGNDAAVKRVFNFRAELASRKLQIAALTEEVTYLLQTIDAAADKIESLRSDLSTLSARVERVTKMRHFSVERLNYKLSKEHNRILNLITKNVEKDRTIDRQKLVIAALRAQHRADQFHLALLLPRMPLARSASAS